MYSSRCKRLVSWSVRVVKNDEVALGRTQYSLDFEH